MSSPSHTKVAFDQVVLVQAGHGSLPPLSHQLTYAQLTLSINTQQPPAQRKCFKTVPPPTFTLPSSRVLFFFSHTDRCHYFSVGDLLTRSVIHSEINDKRIVECGEREPRLSKKKTLTMLDSTETLSVNRKETDTYPASIMPDLSLTHSDSLFYAYHKPVCVKVSI